MDKIPNLVYKLAYIEINGKIAGLLQYVYDQVTPFERLVNYFGFDSCLEYIDALPGTYDFVTNRLIKRIGVRYVDKKFTYHNDDSIEILYDLHDDFALVSCAETTWALCNHMHSKEDSPFVYPRVEYVKLCKYFDDAQEKDMWFCSDWKG